MASTATNNDLRKGARVVAAHDLAHVPEGTSGKVMLVNGLSWIRYWVRFDNGVTMGSINRTNLATPKEWERKLSGAVDQPTNGATADAAESEAASDGGGGGGVAPGHAGPVAQKPTALTRRPRAPLGP